MKKRLLQLAVLLVSLEGAFSGDFEEHFKDKYWVREYYNEVILEKDRNVILSYVPRYKERPSVFDYEFDSEVYWYEESVIDKCEYDFSKIFDTYYLVVFFAGFDIVNIQQIDKNVYQVIIETESFNKESFEEALNLGCNWQEENIVIERFYLKFDGDYLYIYLNEKTNLLATYCAYDEFEYHALVEAIKTNNFDNMAFTFPRHEDGSCDYDDSALKPSQKFDTGTFLRIGKAIAAKEDLRVYLDKKTSSAILITLAAGTPVEIIGIGEEDVIGGITSNWVHVKVMPGTIGTDGIEMEWAMYGWCFGGLTSVKESAADAPAKAAVPKPAPALGTTAVVTENLRLRTNGTATAEVVTTLAAGTRVKVLAHGREDTIDGIASCWVQVRVPSGAMDKAGTAIEGGTTGWLFGGYLAETEDPAESESLDREEAEATNTPASRRGSHLPIVPMAAGVVVLAVIVAVIVLATKKKEAGKK